MLSALIACCVVAVVGAYVAAPRPGGRLDPSSTDPDGGHALVVLLREHGVTVDVADSVDDAVRKTTPDSLLLFGQTQRVTDEPLLQRLAGVPGDLLVVEPTSRARAALSPGVRSAGSAPVDNAPNCAMREANQAQAVDFGPAHTFRAVAGRSVTSCYGGALVRYRDGNRNVTVVGGAEFMTNAGLLRAGNAALAMNLAGERRRLVWFAPQHIEGGTSAKARIFDLIPKNVTWMVVQLWLTAALVALWKSRRLGPLVAEDLPVVVRASETVEGRGRLYRSRRSRDRAAHALRTATLRRLTPRLGLAAGTGSAELLQAIASQHSWNSEVLWHILFGPAPITDTDLVQLALALDDIERQVTRS